MLLIIFNRIYRKISFTFAVVVFSLCSAWIAAFYAFTFIYATVDFTSDETFFITVFFPTGLAIATILHSIHFGLFHPLGFSGLSMNIKFLNQYLETDSVFKTIPESARYKKIETLHGALMSLPKANLIASSVYGMMFVLSFTITYYIFTLKAANILFILLGGISASLIYGYFSYNITEYLIGPVKMKAEGILFQKEKNITRSYLISIGHKSLIVLVLTFFSMLLLSIIITKCNDLVVQIAFITESILIMICLIAILIYSIRFSLEKINASTKDLANGGRGIYLPFFSNREFTDFAYNYNLAAIEIDSLRKNLEDKVKQRTRELQAAMEKQEAMNDRIIDTNNRLEEARRISEMDMKFGANLQRALFPEQSPDVEGWDVAFECKPMAGISGDMYDFYVRDGRLLGIALFDVSGHGLAPGLITMIARKVIYKSFIKGWNKELRHVIQKINTDLIHEIRGVDYYLSGLLLRFKDPIIEYVNAAHPDIYYKKNGRVKTAAPDNGFGGSILGIEEVAMPFEVLSLEPGKDDTFLLYTDCLSEARDDKNEEYGDHHLSAAFSDANGSAREILDYIMDNFNNFLKDKTPVDDLTVIIVKKTS